ncbi:MAG: cytochrome c-type biogenesis protein CcmH [Candidatus Latescibacterota bacterium]
MDAHRPQARTVAALQAARWPGRAVRACLVALVLGAVPGALAWGAPSQAEVDAQAREIFTTVMSPYCPGQMLADCTSSAAAELRLQIKEQLAGGVPPTQIRAELVSAFGEDILALPPSRGMGLVAWVGPIAALAAGLAILFWWVRQRQLGGGPAEAAMAGAQAPAASATPSREDLRARLEEELRRYD